MEQLGHDERSQITQKMLSLGSFVDRMVDQAVAAVLQRDSRLAEATIASDEAVDRLEREVRDDCIRQLAVCPLTPDDVNFLTTVIKVTADLERIGDRAAIISQLAVVLSGEPRVTPYSDLPRMSELSRKMLLDSLVGLTREDVRVAREVISGNKNVDALRDQLFRVILTFMLEDPQNVPPAVLLLQVSDELKRIAEHAVEIGEMAIRLVEWRPTGPPAQPAP